MLASADPLIYLHVSFSIEYAFHQPKLLLRSVLALNPPIHQEIAQKFVPMLLSPRLEAGRSLDFLHSHSVSTSIMLCAVEMIEKLCIMYPARWKLLVFLRWPMLRR